MLMKTIHKLIEAIRWELSAKEKIQIQFKCENFVSWRIDFLLAFLSLEGGVTKSVPELIYITSIFWITIRSEYCNPMIFYFVGLSWKSQRWSILVYRNLSLNVFGGTRPWYSPIPRRMLEYSPYHLQQKFNEEVLTVEGRAGLASTE